MRQPQDKNRTKGFTLVEMIVVGVILVILLSVGAGAIVKYQHFSMYKQNNEYARTLFSSAQSALSYYQSGGGLKELAEKVKTPEHKVSSGTAGEPGDWYYLEIKKGDDLETNLLYQILKDYVYLEAVWDAAIRLEFNPDTGAVLSVCYSNRADRFDENPLSAGLRSGVLGVSGRAEEDWDSLRQKYILGYYSASAPEEIPDAGDSVDVTSVEWSNGEELRLLWTVDGKLPAEQYRYQVDLFQETTYSPKVTIRFDGTYLADETPMLASTECTVTWQDGTEKTLACRAAKKDGKIMLVLDSVDLAAARQQDAGNKESSAYDGTYSIMRLGLEPSQRILATVSASAEGVVSGMSATTATWEQPVLGSSSKEEIREYQVENVRHLFNLRFLEAGGTQHSYIQKTDLSWSGENGLLTAGYVYDACGIVTADSGAAFPTIPILNAGSSYQPEAAQILADFCFGSSRPLSEATQENAVEKSGLFGENKGEIRNLTLKNSTLRPEFVNDAGLICGYNTGVIENITAQQVSVTMVSEDAYYAITNLGGIAGVSDTTITNCKVDGIFSLGVQGTAGGIVGYGKEDIADCTFQGELTVMGAGSGIGGIAGVLEKNVENCRLGDKENPVTLEVDSVDRNNAGAAVGGVVGVSRGSAKNCEYWGSLSVGEEAKLAGGILGSVTGTAELCSYYGDLLVESESAQQIGGIAGTVGGGLIQCSFEGNLEANSADYLGGIAGTAQLDIRECSFKGSILVTSAQMFGGVAGEANGNVIQCSYLGTAEAESANQAGGIAAAANQELSQCAVGSEEEPAEFTVKNGFAGSVGGLAGVCQGKLSESSYWGNIILEGGKGLGGIAGMAMDEITSCTYQGEIATKTTGNVGGIAGESWGDITGCRIQDSKIAVGNSMAVGGISGYSHETISDCTAQEVEVNAQEGSTVGGIAGSSYGTISGCSYQGSIQNETNSPGYSAGGIVGAVEDNSKQVLACEADGSLTGFSGQELGGIVGSWTGDGEVSSCVNRMNITGGSASAGIVGGQTTEGSLTIRQCRNYGKPLEALAEPAETAAEKLPEFEFGGILGYRMESLKAETSILDCYGVSDVKYPITRYTVQEEQTRKKEDLVSDQDNYYFVEPENEIRVIEIAAPAPKWNWFYESFLNTNNPYAKDRMLTPSGNYFYWIDDTSAKSYEITFTFSDTVELESLQVDWRFGSAILSRFTKEYEFEIWGGNEGTFEKIYDGTCGQANGSSHGVSGIRFAPSAGMDQLKISFQATTSGWLINSGIWSVRFNPSDDQQAVRDYGAGIPLDVRQDTDQTYRGDYRGKPGSKVAGMEIHPHLWAWEGTGQAVSNREVFDRIDPYLYLPVSNYSLPETPGAPDVTQKPSGESSTQEPFGSPESTAEAGTSAVPESSDTAASSESQGPEESREENTSGSESSSTSSSTPSQDPSSTGSSIPLQGSSSAPSEGASPSMQSGIQEGGGLDG